jgi:hypothetical protein
MVTKSSQSPMSGLPLTLYHPTPVGYRGGLAWKGKRVQGSSTQSDLWRSWSQDAQNPHTGLLRIDSISPWLPDLFRTHRMAFFLEIVGWSRGHPDPVAAFGEANRLVTT